MTAWDDAKLELEQRELKHAFRERHEKVIKGAFALLKPDKPNQKECEKDIIVALMALSVMKASWFTVTKPAKKAARDLSLALKRVEKVMGNKNLDSSLRKRFPSAEIRELKLLSEKWEKPKAASKGPRRKAEEKKSAIGEAHFLMAKYRSNEVEKTNPDSNFCKLAALLFGEPKANLSNQCKAFVREARKKLG